MKAASNASKEALLNKAQAAGRPHVSMLTLQRWQISGRAPLADSSGAVVVYLAERAKTE